MFAVDDLAAPAVTRPRLTSVDQPRAIMGRTATELLWEHMGGRTGDGHEVPAPALAVRDSTAPPGQRRGGGTP